MLTAPTISKYRLIYTSGSNQYLVQQYLHTQSTLLHQLNLWLSTLRGAKYYAHSDTAGLIHHHTFSSFYNLEQNNLHSGSIKARQKYPKPNLHSKLGTELSTLMAPQRYAIEISPHLCLPPEITQLQLKHRIGSITALLLTLDLSATGIVE